jgi:hypothetical protein
VYPRQNPSAADKSQEAVKLRVEEDEERDESDAHQVRVLEPIFDRVSSS